MCKFEGCNRRVRAKGLCASHYRMYNKGKPLRPIEERKYYRAPAAGKKICTSCERVLDREKDFYKRRTVNSVFSMCKDCTKKMVAEYKANQRLAKKVGSHD